MGFWESLAEGSLKGLVGGIGDFAKDIRTAITGKEALSSEQQIEIIKQANALENLAIDLEKSAADGQIALNKLDAQSGSMFKGGWRPAIGWICALGLGYSFLLRPLLPFFVKVLCEILSINVEIPTLPKLDMPELFAMVMSLLGFGGLRSFERLRGVNAK
jgi:hypothetical protein